MLHFPWTCFTPTTVRQGILKSIFTLSVQWGGKRNSWTSVSLTLLQVHKFVTSYLTGTGCLGPQCRIFHVQARDGRLPAYSCGFGTLWGRSLLSVPHSWLPGLCIHCATIEKPCEPGETVLAFLGCLSSRSRPVPDILFPHSALTVLMNVLEVWFWFVHIVTVCLYIRGVILLV